MVKDYLQNLQELKPAHFLSTYQDLINNSSPLAAMLFLLNKLQEFVVRSRQQLLPDEFVYSHYLFAG